MQRHHLGSSEQRIAASLRYFSNDLTRAHAGGTTGSDTNPHLTSGSVGPTLNPSLPPPPPGAVAPVLPPRVARRPDLNAAENYASADIKEVIQLSGGDTNYAPPATSSSGGGGAASADRYGWGPRGYHGERVSAVGGTADRARYRAENLASSRTVTAVLGGAEDGSGTRATPLASETTTGAAHRLISARELAAANAPLPPPPTSAPHAQMVAGRVVVGGVPASAASSAASRASRATPQQQQQQQSSQRSPSQAGQDRGGVEGSSSLAGGAADYGFGVRGPHPERVSAKGGSSAREAYRSRILAGSAAADAIFGGEEGSGGGSSGTRGGSTTGGRGGGPSAQHRPDLAYERTLKTSDGGLIAFANAGTPASTAAPGSSSGTEGGWTAPHIHATLPGGGVGGGRVAAPVAPVRLTRGHAYAGRNDPYKATSIY